VETAKATSQKLEHCIGFAVSLHGAVKYYDGQAFGNTGELAASADWTTHLMYSPSAFSSFLFVESEIARHFDQLLSNARRSYHNAS